MAESPGLLEKVSSKIAEVIDNVTTLKITTVIGNIKLANDGQIPETLVYDGAVKMLVTHINMLQGDITTVLPAEALTDEPYKALQTFHAAQIQEGRNIVQANLEMLHELFRNIQTSNAGPG